MPRVHVYLPGHLASRRHELPPHRTLSGMLAEKFEEELSKLDAHKLPTKATRKKTA